MKMGFFAGVEYKGKVFFSDLRGLGLFSFNLLNGVIEFCCLFEELYVPVSYRKAFLYNNEAWFIPQEGEVITCVNLDTFSMENYHVPYKRTVPNNKKKFRDAIIVGDFLVCAPFDIDTLVVIDLKKHIMSCVDDFINPEKESILSIDRTDDEVVFFPKEGNRIIYYNFKNGDIRNELRKDNFGDYSDVAIFKGKTVFVPWNKAEVLIVDSNGKRKITGFEEEENFYCGHTTMDNKLLFAPLRWRRFLLLDVCNSSAGYEYINYLNGKYSNPVIQIYSKDKILFSDALNSTIVEINPSNYQVNQYELEIDVNSLRDSLASNITTCDANKLYFRDNTMLFEEANMPFSLLSYVKAVVGAGNLK